VDLKVVTVDNNRTETIHSMADDSETWPWIKATTRHFINNY